MLIEMPPPATVLYVENGVGFGGAVISLRTFLEHVDRDRYRSVLVHSLEDEKFASFDGVAETVHVSRWRYSGNRLLAALIKGLNLDVLVYAFKLAKVAREQKADLLYLNNDFIANLSGVIAGWMIGRPVVIHERDIPAPHSRLAQWLIRWTERFLAISGPVRQALLDMGVPLERITMVPEGLDLNLYHLRPAEEVAALREKMGVDAGQGLIVMVGMIMEWKGQHVLVESAKEILARHPDTRFVIIGETPPGREEYLHKLQDRVEILGLGEAIEFIGYRDDIPLYAQAADAVVHASISPEPFGRVVIEAMVMGTPIVATSIGAPPEIVKDGVTGFLVPPSDPERLAEVLNKILDDPDFRAQVGHAARQDALQNYAIDRHAGLIQAVFDELLWADLPGTLYQ